MSSRIDEATVVEDNVIGTSGIFDSVSGARYGSEPTSPVAPVAAYPPPVVPDDSTPGSAAEFYGFVAWLATAILWFTYILWALLPDSIIRQIGISWYPSREWALLIPSYAVFLILLTYFTYFALAIYATPSYSEVKSITDEHANYRVKVKSDTSKELDLNEETIPQAYDLPIGLVNRVLYSRRRQPRQQSSK